MKPRRILAVDTSGDVMTLALADGDAIWGRRVRAAAGHDEKLLPELRRLLARAGLCWTDLEALAAVSGPGSFTGVRVGMTFIATLAATLGRPAAAVSRFEVEVLRAEEGGRGPEPSLIAAAIPGRGEEFYFQAFARLRLRPIAPPQRVADPSALRSLRAAAGRRDILVVGGAAEQALKALKALGLRAEARAGSSMDARSLLAASVHRFSRPGPLGEFAPLYLQPAYYEKSKTAH